MNQKTILRIECKRAFHSKGFYTALLIGCALTLTESWHHFQNVYEGIPFEMQKNWYSANTAYTQWISNDVCRSSLIYYIIFPVLAALPHAASYLQDRKSGYLKNILLRCSRKKYNRAKYVSVFLAGGVAVGFPLWLNFFLTTLYLPLRPIDLLAGSIGPAAAWVELAYSHSALYTGIYLVLPFLTGGLFATVSLLVARKVDYYFTVLISPFIFSMLLYNFAAPLGAKGLAPFYFLQMSFGSDVKPVVCLSLLLILFVVGWFGFAERGRKDETF